MTEYGNGLMNDLGGYFVFSYWDYDGHAIVRFGWHI